jgi:putative acetyltransferase
MTTAPAPTGLREVVDADGPALTALIGGVFAEYPGCVLDLDDLDDDLPAPRSAFAARGARLWVVEDDRGGLDACVGIGPVGRGGDLPGRSVELKRLYVTAAARGRGLGTALIEHVHDVAATNGAEVVELWSDTRFAAGHRRYVAAGYEQRPATRRLHDPSDTTEAAFWRRLEGPPAATAVRATWIDGDGVRERTTVHESRATNLLTSTVLTDVVLDTELVTDERWRARRLVVRRDGRAVAHLNGDGLGRWWRAGQPVPALDGCLDVAVASTVIPHAATVMRLAADGVGTTHVLRLDPTTGLVTAADCTWTRRGPDEWLRTSGAGATPVTTDVAGLPLTAGTSRRVTSA